MKEPREDRDARSAKASYNDKLWSVGDKATVCWERERSGIPGRGTVMGRHGGEGPPGVTTVMAGKEKQCEMEPKRQTDVTDGDT